MVNFMELKRLYIRYMPGAEDMGIGWLVIILIVALLIWVIWSGKKINLRIPFLPRFMNRMTFSKDDLTALKDKASALKDSKDEAAGEAPDGAAKTVSHSKQYAEPEFACTHFAVSDVTRTR